MWSRRRSSRLTGIGIGTLCAGAALTGLTGCGAGDPDAGTNGVGKLPPTTIVTEAKDAAEKADTVRLSGSLVSRGQTYRLDMRLSADGGTGQVATDKTSFELLRLGKDLYLKAGPDFYAGAQPSTASQLGGKYVKVPAGDPAYQQLSGFTDKKVLLDGLFSLGPQPARGDHGSVNGTRTIAVTSGTGTLDVSLQGSPYPLRYERSGGAGSLQLADWGQAVTLQPPDSASVVSLTPR